MLFFNKVPLAVA